MKQLINLAGISLAMLVFSPVVHGHIAAEHSYGFIDGITHMLTDPAHVAFWIELLLFVMLVFMRKRVISVLNWFITNIFR